MTKDEITKALTETSEGQPSGVMVQWEDGNKSATVTLPNRKSFELKNEEHYFLMRLESYFTIYGTDLSILTGIVNDNKSILVHYRTHLVGYILL